MNTIFELLRSKKAESRAAIEELENRKHFASKVLEEVYASKCDKLEKKKAFLVSLIAQGDYEAAMEKLSSIDSLMEQSPLEEIRERLSEYNLKNVTTEKE